MIRSIRRRYRRPLDKPRPEDFGRYASVAIETRIEPAGRKWRWEAKYVMTLDCGISMEGCWSPGGGSRWHPKPDYVQGFARSQATATKRLAEATDLMRSLIVAARAEWDHRQARGQSAEVTP